MLELDLIRELFNRSELLVACGGGGIPVVWRGGWGYEGIEAVIDKDLTSGLLADGLNADLLVIVTGEDAVYQDFGTPKAKRLDHLLVGEAEALLEAGQFPSGSMGPKIEAAIQFVKGNSSREAIITSCENLSNAVGGWVGTHIVADK